MNTTSGKLRKLLRRISSHVSGGGCRCAAYGECECGCPNVDWRSKREVAAVSALVYCLQTLKTYHSTSPGITETIRNTESIMDAGNYTRKTLSPQTK